MEKEIRLEEAKETVVEYPIAEIFDSVQGEGHYAGTRFAFIRFAGCTVGRPRTREESYGLINQQGAQSPVYEMCTLWDNRTFVCDTNYRKTEKRDVQFLVDWVKSLNVKHVCFTGGEPLMHNIKPLLDELRRQNFMIHIETSGTIAPSWLLSLGYTSVYIAVAPKRFCLDQMVYRANEIKLLVDDKFDIEKIPSNIRSKDGVFLQPVNFILGIDKSNVDRCLEILKQFPKWKLSVQLHKVIGVR